MTQQTEPRTLLVSIAGVTRRFGDVVALDDVSLEIRAGRVLRAARPLAAAARPRCCGSSPASRRPTPARVALDGEDLLGMPPHRRPVNLMFQSYALFPHMTVERNVAYGLEREGCRAGRGPRPGRRGPGDGRAGT